MKTAGEVLVAKGELRSHITTALAALEHASLDVNDDGWVAVDEALTLAVVRLDDILPETQPEAEERAEEERTKRIARRERGLDELQARIDDRVQKLCDCLVSPVGAGVVERIHVCLVVRAVIDLCERCSPRAWTTAEGEPEDSIIRDVRVAAVMRALTETMAVGAAR